jgi:hypothetical protein
VADLRCAAFSRSFVLRWRSIVSARPNARHGKFQTIAPTGDTPTEPTAVALGAGPPVGLRDDQAGALAPQALVVTDPVIANAPPPSVHTAAGSRDVLRNPPHRRCHGQPVHAAVRVATTPDQARRGGVALHPVLERRAGSVRRSWRGHTGPVECPGCGEEFVRRSTYGPAPTYCGDTCRVRARRARRPREFPSDEAMLQALATLAGHPPTWANYANSTADTGTT